MRTFTQFLLFALVASTCAGQPTHPLGKNSWTFQSPKGAGAVVIELTSIPSTLDHQPVYSLQIMCGGSSPTAADETEFLKSVIRDMESNGMPPARISFVALELCEPDVSRRLSNAALESDTWKNAKPTEQGRVVVQLLNETGAYGAFNDAFVQYGLSVKVDHAEHIVTSRPEDLGLHKDGVVTVPVSATLEIGLKSVSKN